MKLLASLFLSFICSIAVAGPGDGPIVPWPTSVRENIHLNDIEGNWVAYGHNSIWYIDIIPALGIENVAVIKVRSTALFTHQAEGLVNASEGLFWGKLTMDEKHHASIYLYKNTNGMTLRMGHNSRGFFELKLYKLKSGSARD